MVLELTITRNGRSTIVLLNGVRIASVTRSGLVRRYQRVITDADALKDVVLGSTANQLWVIAKDRYSSVELCYQDRHLFDLVETGSGWSIRFGKKVIPLLQRESQAVEQAIAQLRTVPEVIKAALEDNLPRMPLLRT